MARKILGWLVDFGLAWRLLTIIPLPFIPEDFSRPAGKSVAYYPLVGLILGLFLAGVAQLLYNWLPAGVTAALILILWAALTGFLHLDGLMDSCDGLLPPRDPARRLEIMKDSQVGAFGVVGAMLLLLLKYSALQSLPASKVVALMVIPTLARWALTWLMTRYPLARPEGLSVFFGDGLGWPQVLGGSLVAGSVAVGVMGGYGLLLIAVTWLVATLIARLTLARISGLTGDVYGATCEVVEGVLLVVSVALF